MLVLALILQYDAFVEAAPTAAATGAATSGTKTKAPDTPDRDPSELLKFVAASYNGAEGSYTPLEAAAARGVNVDALDAKVRKWIERGNLAKALEAEIIGTVHLPIRVNLLPIGLDGSGHLGLTIPMGMIHNWLEHLAISLPHLQVDRWSGGPSLANLPISGVRRVQDLTAMADKSSTSGQVVTFDSKSTTSAKQQVDANSAESFAATVGYAFDYRLVETSPLVAQVIDRVLHAHHRMVEPHNFPSDAQKPSSKVLTTPHFQVDGDLIGDVISDLMEALDMNKGYTIAVLNPKKDWMISSLKMKNQLESALSGDHAPFYGYRHGLSNHEIEYVLNDDDIKKWLTENEGMEAEAAEDQKNEMEKELIDLGKKPRGSGAAIMHRHRLSVVQAGASMFSQEGRARIREALTETDDASSANKPKPAAQEKAASEPKDKAPAASTDATKEDRAPAGSDQQAQATQQNATTPVRGTNLKSTSLRTRIIPSRSANKPRYLTGTTRRGLHKAKADAAAAIQSAEKAGELPIPQSAIEATATSEDEKARKDPKLAAARARAKARKLVLTLGLDHKDVLEKSDKWARDALEYFPYDPLRPGKSEVGFIRFMKRVDPLTLRRASLNKYGQESCLSDNWVGHGRVAFVDLSAGPLEWGPVVGGEGVKTNSTFPFVDALAGTAVAVDVDAEALAQALDALHAPEHHPGDVSYDAMANAGAASLLFFDYTERADEAHTKQALTQDLAAKGAANVQGSLTSGRAKVQLVEKGALAGIVDDPEQARKGRTSKQANVPKNAGGRKPLSVEEEEDYSYDEYLTEEEKEALGMKTVKTTAAATGNQKQTQQKASTTAGTKSTPGTEDDLESDDLFNALTVEPSDEILAQDPRAAEIPDPHEPHIKAQARLRSELEALKLTLEEARSRAAKTRAEFDRAHELHAKAAKKDALPSEVHEAEEQAEAAIDAADGLHAEDEAQAALDDVNRQLEEFAAMSGAAVPAAETDITATSGVADAGADSDGDTGAEDPQDALEALAAMVGLGRDAAAKAAKKVRKSKQTVIGAKKSETPPTQQAASKANGWATEDAAELEALEESSKQSLLLDDAEMKAMEEELKLAAPPQGGAGKMRPPPKDDDLITPTTGDDDDYSIYTGGAGGKKAASGSIDDDTSDDEEPKTPDPSKQEDVLVAHSLLESEEVNPNLEATVQQIEAEKALLKQMLESETCLSGAHDCSMYQEELDRLEEMLAENKSYLQEFEKAKTVIRGGADDASSTADSADGPLAAASSPDAKVKVKGGHLTFVRDSVDKAANAKLTVDMQAQELAGDEWEQDIVRSLAEGDDAAERRQHKAAEAALYGNWQKQLAALKAAHAKSSAGVSMGSRAADDASNHIWELEHFLSSLSATIAQAQRSVVVPSMANMHLAKGYHEHVIFSLYVLKNHNAFDPLENDFYPMFKIAMNQLRLKGQEFSYTVTHLSMSDDPVLAMAYASALRSSVVPALMFDGHFAPIKRLYIDSKVVEHELRERLLTQHGPLPKGTREIPIFMFSINSPLPVFVDKHFQARALPSMVIAVQSNYRLWESVLQCNQRPIFWNLRNPLRAMVASTAQLLGGLLPSYQTFDEVHYRESQSWPWAVGDNPLSPISSSEYSIRFSQLHIDALHRNYIITAIRKATSIINRAVLKLRTVRTTVANAAILNETYSEKTKDNRGINIPEWIGLSEFKLTRKAYRSAVFRIHRMRKLVQKLDFAKAVTKIPHLLGNSYQFSSLVDVLVRKARKFDCKALAKQSDNYTTKMLAAWMSSSTSSASTPVLSSSPQARTSYRSQNRGLGFDGWILVVIVASLIVLLRLCIPSRRSSTNKSD